MLYRWRNVKPCKDDKDWLWAGPFSAGEKPYHLNAIQRDYIIPATVKAGLGSLCAS